MKGKKQLCCERKIYLIQFSLTFNLPNEQKGLQAHCKKKKSFKKNK